MSDNPSYSEGDFFAVPLKTGGFGVGLAVCLGVKHDVVAHFFGPVRESVPSIDDLVNLTELNSAHIEHFLDDGLRDGSWEVIGQYPEWDAYDWPIPKFGWLQRSAADSANNSPGQAFEVELDENLRAARQKKVSIEHFNSLPYEILVGSKDVEITLALALTRPGWKRKIPDIE